MNPYRASVMAASASSPKTSLKCFWSFLTSLKTLCPFPVSSIFFMISGSSSNSLIAIQLEGASKPDISLSIISLICSTCSDTSLPYFNLSITILGDLNTLIIVSRSFSLPVSSTASISITGTPRSCESCFLLIFSPFSWANLFMLSARIRFAPNSII